jgi:hypothetical protein
MDQRAYQDFVRARRHSGRSFLIGGILAAVTVGIFMIFGGDLTFGLSAPDVRIDSAAVHAD